MSEADRIDGEFDDILGPDVPEKYKKASINQKLIEAYERVIKKSKEEAKKEIDNTEYGICTEEKEKLLWKLEKISEIH